MDPVTTGAVVAALVGASAVAVSAHDRANRRRAEALLATRPSLNPGDFGRAYFPESERRASLASEVREVLAKHLPYALDGLAADDAFVEDLRMDELDSMSTVEFILALEDRLKVKIPDAVAGSIRTFRDLVDYLDQQAPESGMSR